MNQSKQRIASIVYKVFFIGLLLQFIAHTFVTYQLGIDNPAMGILWSWKEIIVILWSSIALRYIIKNRIREKKQTVWYMFLVFVALMIYALIDTLIKWIGIVRFFKAWKYDFIGFMIFFATYFTATYATRATIEKIIPRTTRIIKALLIRGLLWFCILLIKPWFFKLFGYDRLSIEWQVWQRPPAVYWTREFEWLPRNQFIFERPISRWFFLTAFFPLFFVQYLQRKSLKKTWFWRAMYSLNVISTYSRAARGSWIIELAVLWVISYRKHIWVFLKKVLIPAIIILAWITRFAKDHVINREFSNTWHIQLFKQWREYFGDNWVWGMGAWSVGPASHWLGWLAFNPENQFLQIAIEFGIIWFGGWMIIYLRYHLLGLYIIKKYWKHKEISKPARYLIAMSIWITGLSISGMVLHSFTDRMIIYPFMMVFGLIYYLYNTTEKGSH